jgi:hypothetical protein
MEEFPFSESEWQEVAELSRLIVNASSANDDTLVSAQFVELVATLGELRTKYGDHPILIETEADFTDSILGQIRLYERAIRLAETNHLPTYTMRISLARILLEEIGNVRRALTELSACKNELTSESDGYSYRKWRDLWQTCQRKCAFDARS